VAKAIWVCGQRKPLCILLWAKWFHEGG
jgi:hypothetical protein